MITTCAAFLIFVLFFAGGEFSAHPVGAFVLGGLCACALGGLFAHLEAMLGPSRHLRRTDNEAMSYMSLATAYPDLFHAPLYYATDSGFKPVKSTFLCRLDGEQVIVLEQEAVNAEDQVYEGIYPGYGHGV